MAESIFRILSIDEFEQYIRRTTFARRITFIQNHHTWKPNYSHFDEGNPRYMVFLENMKRDHIQKRGWKDIGQNITIFPDGKIGLCRAIDITPAGIYGANTGGICIENFGDFDEGGDIMSDIQRDAIIKVNAILCLKFGLKPVPHQVVYHHWYDSKGKRFQLNDIDSGKVLRGKLQKTCPGTNFFCTPGSPKGNSIKCATVNFYPLISTEIIRLHGAPEPTIQPIRKRVIAYKLNVRSGQGTDFKVLRQIPKDMLILIFEIEDGWARVSANSEEWVSVKFLS